MFREKTSEVRWQPLTIQFLEMNLDFSLGIDFRQQYHGRSTEWRWDGSCRNHFDASGNLLGNSLVPETLDRKENLT